MTYDKYTRERVLSLYILFGPLCIPLINEIFHVSERTVFNWVAALRDRNQTAPARHRTPKGWSSIPPEHFQFAINALNQYPLLFHYEISQVIHMHTGITYSNDQVRHALDDAGYTRKVLEFQAKEQFEPLRQIFKAAIAQHSAHQLVFVDESHASPEALRRKYGYAIHNRPAFMKINNVAHGEGPAVSAICSLSLDGMKTIRIVRENVNGDAFIQCLQEDILPTMNAFPLPRSVLILDNASVHRHEEIYYLCQAKGVLVYFLPPYSYDLNPIELAFHQAKHYIRAMYGVVGGHTDAKLAEGLNTVGMNDAVNYYRHCGYTVTDMDIHLAMQ